MTLHAINWLRPTQMVCGVRAEGRAQAYTPAEIECDGCSIRVLRAGQRLGLDMNNPMGWTWAQHQEWRGAFDQAIDTPRFHELLDRLAPIP